MTKSCLVQADDAPAAARAFEANGHDWSQGAQWIILTRRDNHDTVKDISLFAEQLCSQWKIPEVWPETVTAALQAGVDGDAAGIFCKDEATLLSILAKTLSSIA